MRTWIHSTQEKTIARDNTQHEDMFEEFNDNSRHQERKKIKLENNIFRMTRNEYLINHKDSQEFLCNVCNE